MSNLTVPNEADDKPVSASANDYLRAEAIVAAINAAGGSLEPIPKDYVIRQRDRATVTDALHTAFHLLGGVPALIAFAKSNPREFFSMWAKLLPAEQQGIATTTVIVQSPIPTNDLDRVNVVDGQVVRTALIPAGDDLPE